MLHAQGSPDRPPENKRQWTDPLRGTLYWNRRLPVYVFISSSPSPDSLGSPLQSTTPQYSNPCYFDTEGVNFLRTRWAVDTATGQTIRPQQEILWPVYADGLPPSTSLHVEHGIPNPKGSVRLGQQSRITLKATDAVSGLEQIYYSIDGEAFQPYQESLALELEGEHTLFYFAEDHVGNQETVHSFRYTADFTPPTTNLEVLGLHLLESNTLSKQSSIQLVAHDGISAVASTHFRVDSGNWLPYSKTAMESAIKTLKDGQHRIAFYSVDAVGNREAEQRFDFYYDTTPPITISDILGDKFIVEDKIYFSGRTKLKITAVDNHSGVKDVQYSVDGGPFQSYTEPFYMPAEPGWHTVKYFSYDSTENVTIGEHADQFLEYRMKVDRIYVDLTGPSISHSLQGPRYSRNDTLFISPRTQITLHGKDMESGLNRMGYAVNHELFEKEYQSPFNLLGLASGPVHVELFAYDNVGNRNIDRLQVILDGDAPRAAYHLSVEPIGERSESAAQEIATGDETDEQTTPLEDASTYPVDATIYLSAQDALTGVKSISYSLNGNTLREYTKPFQGLQRGSNRLLIKSTDLVGNTREQIVILEAR